MTRERFEFALERIKSSDWKKFEEFASAFLVSEFGSLRTMASASGDRGRDAELFSPEGESSVLLQYSVSEDWNTKVRKTAKRVAEEFSDISLLVYVTNQPIGAEADQLKKEVRLEYGFQLDIRDRGWFLDRQFSSSTHQDAADQLVRYFVDPYLASRKVAGPQSQVLSTAELKAVFVYLKMQWDDASQDKGLTRVCFEALVKAVLRDTDSEHRISREEVRRRVRGILSVHPPEIVDRHTDSALSRLEKKAIRHWRNIDEFCLTHEEKLKVGEKAIKAENDESAVQREIEQIVSKKVQRLNAKVAKGALSDLGSRVRRVLEKTIFKGGESFVAAVRTGDPHQVTADDIREATIVDLSEYPSSNRTNLDYVTIVTAAIENLIAEPSELVLRYLRSLSDTYTLLAFLREAPDVQSAVGKLFSGGTVWLDTSFILPLFAEELLKPEARRFQTIMRAAKESGLQLRITDGVLEEIERHMNRCLAFVRGPGVWRGRVPFLVTVYTSTGRPMSGFPSWLENFRGARRPEADIKEALSRMFGIEVESLEKEASKAPSELREAVEDILHSERGEKDWWEHESQSVSRLVQHDLENYLGVLMKRRAEGDSPFGYSAWWLTLHRAVFNVRSELRRRLGGRVPDSPVLSPDFLVNAFALGPIRRRLSKSTEKSLPLGIDLGIVDYPRELILSAQRAREEMGSLPEHMIRRRIRDEFDAAKMRRGKLSRGGLQDVEKELAIHGRSPEGGHRKPRSGPLRGR